MFFFFFNDTATTEIYTLSLHDALPDLLGERNELFVDLDALYQRVLESFVRKVLLSFRREHVADRKSTRLNSSHANISYAVFCLKKKTQNHLDRYEQTTSDLN